MAAQHDQETGVAPSCEASHWRMLTPYACAICSQDLLSIQLQAASVGRQPWPSDCAQPGQQRPTPACTMKPAFRMRLLSDKEDSPNADRGAAAFTTVDMDHRSLERTHVPYLE